MNELAFAPAPGALEEFLEGVGQGSSRAYTEYKGRLDLRVYLAERLGEFTGAKISAENALIITPGTQGALFLALVSTVSPGSKVAAVQPDYFAIRKIIEFIGAEVVPICLHYLPQSNTSCLHMDRLEAAFKQGVEVFVFSNPNNPTGAIYSRQELEQIANLANLYGVTVVIDQLYSRLIYEGEIYSHLCATGADPAKLITIMGPSKTESLSGYRVGVAFGDPRLIDPMEKLQAIVSLRAAGYCQSVLRAWFSEPPGWIKERIACHQTIRDDMLKLFGEINGAAVRTPQGGSYLFPRLPRLIIPLETFVAALRERHRVIVTPGTEFCPDRTDSIRINFSQNRQSALAAAARISEMVERYRA